MMPWVKLDDQFADHPKIVACGPLASWLYVCGLGYCSRLLTDGFIPDGQLRKLADVEDARGLAERLVEVNLWERCEGGYRVTGAIPWGIGHEPEDQELRNTVAYRHWRHQVLYRDGNRCQACGVTGVPLQAHHIKEFARYPELRFVVSNGTTLCVDCHGAVHGRRLA